MCVTLEKKKNQCKQNINWPFLFCIFSNSVNDNVQTVEGLYQPVQCTQYLHIQCVKCKQGVCSHHILSYK